MTYQVTAQTFNMTDGGQTLYTGENYDLALQIYGSSCAVAAKVTRETMTITVIETTKSGPRERRRTVIQPR